MCDLPTQIALIAVNPLQLDKLLILVATHVDTYGLYKNVDIKQYIYMYNVYIRLTVL